MNHEKQCEVIKQFMIVLAPEIAKHKLAIIRRHIYRQPLDDDGLAALVNAAPLDNATLTLRWSMHLAAEYAACYDQAVYAPANQDADQAALQAPGRATEALRRAKTGLAD